MGVNKVVYGSVSIIDISDSTVTPDTLAKDATAYDAAGEKIVGTMESSDTTALEAALETKITKVPAPQYIVDDNDVAHWNTGKYDYISYINYYCDDGFVDVYISHNDPIIWGVDADNNDSITLPEKYEIIEGEIPESYKWVSYIDGHYIDSKSGTSDIINNYAVWPHVPTDYVNTREYGIYANRLMYNGNIYISQNWDSTRYKTFCWLLTDDGLFQIFGEKMFNGDNNNYLYYDSTTGIIGNVNQDNPYTFIMKQYNIVTGKETQTQYDLTSASVGKNLKKISANVTVCKNQNKKGTWTTGENVVNDFNDYYCKSDVDTAPTKDSTNLLTSGSVYTSMQGKVSKVAAPQYIVDSDGGFHWNTGKYDYISCITYHRQGVSIDAYISHSDPPVIDADDEIQLPADYELLEGETTTAYGWATATGYYKKTASDGSETTVMDYQVWPDAPTMQEYELHAHRLVYNGITYVSQNKNPGYYVNFWWLLTDSGLFQIISEHQFTGTARLSYTSETGVVESYDTAGSTPLSFTLYQYNVATGEKIQHKSSVTTASVGLNLKKVSTNTYLYKDRALLTSENIVNDFSDYWYKSDVDTVPTKDSTNLVTSGGVYDAVDSALTGVLKYQVVSAVPDTPEEGVLYIVTE